MLFGGRLSKDVPCASRLMPLMGGEDPSRSSYHLLLLLRTKKVVAFFAGRGASLQNTILINTRTKA